MEYTVVIERAPQNYAAWVPDLPGCVATAGSREELLDEIREAIGIHVASLREHGEPVPRNPRSTAAVVEVVRAQPPLRRQPRYHRAPLTRRRTVADKMARLSAHGASNRPSPPATDAPLDVNLPIPDSGD